jgi:hypothetical protein
MPPNESATPAPGYRTVTIPAGIQHCGVYATTVRLPWKCIVCGATRGEPFETLSYDGSRALPVDGWTNACGHVENYALVREWLASSKAAEAEQAALRG